MSSAVPSVLLATIASMWRPMACHSVACMMGVSAGLANFKENDVGDRPLRSLDTTVPGCHGPIDDHMLNQLLEDLGRSRNK